jgi:hypothetical protein
VQRQLLDQDGFRCTGYVLNDFEEIRWKPTF